ncbi:MAG: DUF721 domain-containing protein [Bacteroidetes bacterium]|nr:DUF721 domain-containing protein [Bacteroidota bacterium]
MKKRKSNENPVSEVIDLFLHQYGLNNQYKEFKLLQSWKEIMGPMVAKRTQNLNIREGILYVQLDSPVLRNELHFGKKSIIKNLNEEAGFEAIKEIIFR